MIIGGGRKQETFTKSVKREVVSPLLMYNSPPDGQLEFDEFASVAIERFAILQLFEAIGARYMKGGNEYLTKLDGELRKQGFLKTILCSVILEIRKKNFKLLIFS